MRVYPLSYAHCLCTGSHCSVLQVFTIKTKCEDDARRIAAEKDSCMNDLAKAQPFVDEVRMGKYRNAPLMAT